MRCLEPHGQRHGGLVHRLSNLHRLLEANIQTQTCKGASNFLLSTVVFVDSRSYHFCSGRRFFDT